MGPARSDTDPGMTGALPTSMSAAVYHAPRDLRVEARPVPQVAPGEVLLRIDYCGVCGSDLHMVMDGWGRPNSIGGHEYTGSIVALGAEVSGWELGEVVTGGPTPSCGHCEYCLGHRPMLCTEQPTPGVSDFQGAFAEYMQIDAAQLLRLPEGLSPREAALAEPLAVALHGITRAEISPGERALVTGAGPIGMLTLAALLARGIEDVTVSEPSRARRELAAKVGASHVLAPEEMEVPAMPFVTVEKPYAAVFECSGRASALEAGLTQLRKGGTLVLQGTGADRARLDGHRILLNELVITGAYCYDEGGVEAALELLASDSLPTDLLIHPEDVALADLPEAMLRLAAGSIGGKLMVRPRNGDA
jgi:(R,R)-butanediol dehydrogenase/meso-butanediol dehydrogenase/diacetyl reductase